jgi:hypothetical protein
VVVASSSKVTATEVGVVHEPEEVEVEVEVVETGVPLVRVLGQEVAVGVA